MSNFAIVADATCDLDEQFQKKYDVRVIPGHLRLPDGNEISIMPGWVDTTGEAFYKTLKKDPNSYSTSPANVSEFERVFEEYAGKNIPLLAMSISSGISGANGFMLMARKNVLTRHPNAKIYCVDTLRYGPGFGLMVVRASQLRAEGKSLEETAKFLEENRSCFRQSGWLDDLNFVASKGRINHAQAFFGTLAGIKPIGELDANGLTTVLVKVKGAKTAYRVMLEYMEKTIVDPENQTILISHSDRLKQAVEYKAMIEEKFKPKEVIITELYPLCGANIGPGLMAAYYFGTPTSKDLEEEKKIMEDIVSKG